MKNVIDKLSEHASPTPSKWRNEAEFRLRNKVWLRNSQHIAMLMLDKMDKMGINQSQLALRMNCSQQYVSRILKGCENLSLETLSKIEDALDIRLFIPENAVAI